MELSYILNQLGEEREQYFNAVAPPIIQSSNFAYATVAQMREGISDELTHHFYTRGNNPTVEMLRKKLAALEQTEDALVFASGSGAIAAAILTNVSLGDHIICVDKPYSWTHALLHDFLPRFGVESTFVDGKEVHHFRQAIQVNTKLIVLESPNSVTFEMQDIEAVTEVAKEHNILTLMDNSYAGPLFQQPACMGVDIVCHSATKYLNGHSDVVAGVVCTSEAITKRIFDREFMTLGAIISPHDAWLMIRGLRTLEVRMDRVAGSAWQVVQYLEDHPKVEMVYHPFATQNPPRHLAQTQPETGGGQFSITLRVDTIQQIEQFCEKLRHFLLACSWGGHESLVFPTCALLNDKQEAAPGIPWNLVRFYIGMEDPETLKADIEEALAELP